MTTGDTVWVKGTPMDFMEPTVLGTRVNNFDYKPIKNAKRFRSQLVLGFLQRR